MRILFLGDYSGLHATLAAELKRRGHEVRLVSDGGKHMLTPNDVSLHREPGRLGAFRYLMQVMNLMPQLHGYDVVQLINPHFLSLRPGRISYFFKQLKQQNGAVCLTLAGNDCHFVKACLDGHTFRFSQFRQGDEPTPFSRLYPEFEKQWTARQLEIYADMLYANIDGAMSVLWEYHAPVADLLGNRLAFIGLPIDTEAIPYSPMEFPDGKVRLFIGMVRGREVEKGTDILADAARQLECTYPDRLRTVTVSNLPFKDYLEAMRGSHIVLDQLYSYSPALNALDAMAMGRVAATGAQPEIFDFIGEKAPGPVIPLSPLDSDVKATIARYALNPDLLRDMGRRSREYVERHHDVRLVADRYLAHCEKIMR